MTHQIIILSKPQQLVIPKPAPITEAKQVALTFAAGKLAQIFKKSPK